MSFLKEAMDFIIHFPFYFKQGFFLLGQKFNSVVFKFYIWTKKMENKGKEMQQKGKKMLKEIEETKKDI